jgi:hypothetical protein
METLKKYNNRQNNFLFILFALLLSYSSYSQKRDFDIFKTQGCSRIDEEFLYKIRLSMIFEEPNEFYWLSEAVKKFMVDSIIIQIEEVLREMEKEDTIVSLIDMNDFNKNQEVSWLYYKYLKIEKETQLINSMKFYTIENSYYWDTLKNTPGMEITKNYYKSFYKFYSNKRKLCSWLWLLYKKEDIVQDDENIRLFFNDSLCDYDFHFTEPYCHCYRLMLYPVKELFFQFCRDLDSSEKNHCYECMIPKFIKTEFNKKQMTEFYQYHLNWIKLVKEMGLDEIKRQKISPLPPGFTWKNRKEY